MYGQHAGVVQLALMYNAQESDIEVAKRVVRTVTTAPACRIQSRCPSRPGIDLNADPESGWALPHWTRNQSKRSSSATVQVYAAPDDLPKRWSSAGITRVIWVNRQGIRAGKPFQEAQSYLSTLILHAPTFLELTRSHWQMVKDVTLQEDDPPRRGGCAPISWAIFNSFLIPLARRLGCRTLPGCIRHLANQVHQVFRWLT
ncbi:MAG: hypothetical protein LH702_15765 [Phormidesmis sp. CAN_BIN44]|nr:hypothetical protein [Phormidesmis sp. CAN_BIN44]